MSAVLAHVLVVFLVVLAAGCQGNGMGGFGQKLGLKKDADKAAESGEKNEEALGKESEADSGDTADSPVMITGTYLTCHEVASQEYSKDNLYYGCRLADQSSHATVPLQNVAKSWNWDFELPAGSAATVAKTDPPAGSTLHVIYVFSGAARPDLTKIALATRIILQAVLKPGAGPAGQATVVVGNVLSALLGSQGNGTATETQAPSPGDTADATVLTPSGTPVSGGSTQTPPTSQTAQDSGQSGTSGTAETGSGPITATPATEAAEADGGATGTGTGSDSASGSTGGSVAGSASGSEGPAVQFNFVPRGESMDVQISMANTTGVKDFKITSKGSGYVPYDGRTNSDGTLTELTLGIEGEVTVTFMRGTETCTGTGRISIGGDRMLATTCREP